MHEELQIDAPAFQSFQRLFDLADKINQPVEMLALEHRAILEN